MWVRGLDSWHVGVGVGVGVRFGSTVWLWKMKFWFGYLWVYVCVFKRVCIYCFWIVGKGKKHEIWSGEERKYGLWVREKKIWDLEWRKEKIWVVGKATKSEIWSGEEKICFVQILFIYIFCCKVFFFWSKELLLCNFYVGIVFHVWVENEVRYEREEGVSLIMQVAILYSLHQFSPWVPWKVDNFEFLEWKFNWV